MTDVRNRLAEVLSHVRKWALGLEAGDTITEADLEHLAATGLYSVALSQPEQAEEIREAKREAWDEGFDKGFYDGQIHETSDACESTIENPYERPVEEWESDE